MTVSMRWAPRLPWLAGTGLVVALGAASDANAACDDLWKSAATVAPAEVAPTFVKLVSCDAAVAQAHFEDFMRASKDIDTLVSLSLSAIDAGMNPPVWAMLDQLPDLSTRDEVAREVGAACAEHPKVVAFLEGAHGQLRDRQFGMWRDAYRECAAPELDTWLATVVSAPPSVAYDEKFNVVSEALVKKQRGAAMPVLQKAAIAAGKSGGPFTTVLDRMNEAVRPDTFGAPLSDADRAKLEAALVEVAKQVSPELAAQVADRLYQAGAESAAASLLPTIYADRAQGKLMLYGVAAVESCDKQAIVHYAEVTDPAKRWSIVDDVQGPARAFKPKLTCTAEGEWPVLTTPEPLPKGGLETWLATIESEWAGKGLDVKLKEEKAIALQ